MEHEINPKKRVFPTFPVIILVTGILWLINDLHILTIDIPWFPIVLIILGIGWIIDFYKGK
ncbi:hypothetical protein [Methanolobus psychrotolerans]|uniref:hypothetical protein n=1 Tax=Methanolobus psychrotolerans TaxID=1874706 RepID=UPI000B918E24|nr:hypothetical protein [Methanolobus psychrotolerans]